MSKKKKKSKTALTATARELEDARKKARKKGRGK